MDSTLGPCGSVPVALEVIRTEALDLAVLDVNLDGEEVYPVAAMLAERDIPFLFVSGYGADALPAGHPGWRVCAKPFKSDDLAVMLSAVLESVHSWLHLSAAERFSVATPSGGLPAFRHQRDP